jgi:putative nucleotidyltransferase with HDIG domain
MVSPAAFSADPLRVVRLARIAVGLGFTIDPATADAAREAAPGLSGVAEERIFAEFKQVIVSERPGEGLALLEELGALAQFLPELVALRGVEQSVYHHRDVYGHTMEVLDHAVAITRDPEARLGFAVPGVETFLDAPLADELTRGDALRIGALLHDIAKPQTRDVTDEGRITFFHHDVEGAALVRSILGRLRASEKLCAHVAAMTQTHLALGFLVHQMPLSPRAVYGYLATTDPVSADVTLLSVADRLATRGRNADRAIDLHLALAAEMLPRALAWHTDPPRAPIRGDRLAAALDRTPGPWLSDAMAEVTEAAFAREVDVSSEDAVIAHVRGWLSERGA